MLPARYQVDWGRALSGGFGTVTPVYDTYLGREVLFKYMHDPNEGGQILNEVRALSAARSRHVVDIYDVISDDQGEVVGIIIEKLTGREYATFYTEAVGNPHGFTLLVYQISSALSDLHAKGIVHRDLKLQNMRADDSGILKLFDFGISTTEPNYRTQANRATLHYAAPELFRPGAQITPQMDVYAMGVCAWALAVAKLPDALMEVPPQHYTAAPSLASAFGQGLSAEVASVIDRCLSVDPALRPEASVVRDQLGKHLVRGAHKGLFFEGQHSVYELSASKPNVRIQIGQLGELRVAYDGVKFYVTNVSGDVYINNERVVIGSVLPGACVITFGDFLIGANRRLGIVRVV